MTSLAIGFRYEALMFGKKWDCDFLFAFRLHAFPPEVPLQTSALQRTLCRTMIMALDEGTDQPVSVVPEKCSRLARAERPGTPCFATNALPDHDNGSW